MTPKESASAAQSEESTSRRLSVTRKRTEEKAMNGGLTPTWWVPLSLTLMVIGLLWVITYYVSSGGYPIPGIDMVNIVIGFVFIMAGFVMLTRWK